MAIIKCPECGHQVSDRAKTCPSCGVEIEGRITRCPECGEVVFKNQEQCPACHHPLPTMPAPATGGGTEIQESAQTTIPVETITYDSEETQQPRQKHTKTATAVVVVIVVLLITALTAVYIYKNQEGQNEIDAYGKVMASTEPAELQNYLDIYTDAPEAHRDSVETRLRKLQTADTEWANAVASGSKAALEKYMQLHPTSLHNVEAKIKIDSLDWVSACETNTTEAYQAYISNHPDGQYADDARAKFEKLDALTVSPEEQQAINNLFAQYFTSLAANDPDGLTACLANIMDSYLHKNNATKADVIKHMEKLHSEADVTNITFRLNNDWKITKTDVGDNRFKFGVEFSVDQKTEYTEPEKGTFCTLNVSAAVTPDLKISELNMRKIVQ